MLKKLTVRNYAIIEHIELNFSDHLNIITGETGAGKSIIIGALSLILGQRADSKTLYSKESKCIVEGVFTMHSDELKKFFTEHDLDYSDETIIRREINPAGKSRSFINDTPVNLNALKQLGMQLINLHSQHETLALGDNLFQLKVVDNIAGHDTILKQFNQEYQQLKQYQNQLESLINSNTGIADKDYLAFQFGELKEAGLIGGEDNKLEEELKMLENAEEIKTNLTKSYDLIDQSENSVNSQLSETLSLIKHVENFNPEIQKLYLRIGSCQIELQDISEELLRIGQETNFDPGRIEEIYDRLNTINRLQQKHKTASVEELIYIRDTIETQLQSFDLLTGKIEEIQKKINGVKEILTSTGREIHLKRKAEIPKIESRVEKMLHDLGMPNAQFKIKIEEQPFERITRNGLDKVTFLFSANKGSHFDELKQVASGGELSRLMLVLKSLIAASKSMPTLIFDEIDTGISGETAIKVSKLLGKLGNVHQVISITHLPQIARMGQKHFYVYKDIIENKTVTKVNELNDKERIIEIAKMIGGDKYTDTALKSAKELLVSHKS